MPYFYTDEITGKIKIKDNYMVNKLLCTDCGAVYNYPTVILTTTTDPDVTSYAPIQISGHIEIDDTFCPKCEGKLLLVNEYMIYAIHTLCNAGIIVKKYYNPDKNNPYGYIEFEEATYRYLIEHNIKAPEIWNYEVNDTSLRPCVPINMTKVSPEMHQCFVNNFTENINAWAEKLAKKEE